MQTKPGTTQSSPKGSPVIQDPGYQQYRERRQEVAKFRESIQELHRSWLALLKPQRRQIFVFTAVAFVGMQFFGNLAAVYRVLVSLQVSTSEQEPPQGLAAANWQPCASLDPANMQGIATQCLAVLGALTIALFAAPNIKGPVSLASISLNEWSDTFRRLAAGAAGIINAVALSAGLETVSRIFGTQTTCESAAGVFTPLVLLAAICQRRLNFDPFSAVEF